MAVDASPRLIDTGETMLQANRPRTSLDNSPECERLSTTLRLLAGLMRSLPTDVRRIDVIWQGLYRRIGGGGFAPDRGVDLRWPRGLQRPVRGRHRWLMQLNLQNWSDRRAFFSGGYYQQDINRLLVQLLRPGDQYVDVGANVGMTALLARRQIGPTGKGLAFEPNPRAFSRLRRHFEINGITNFELVPCAVSETESVLELYVPGDEMLLGTFVPEKAEGTRVEVRTVPADGYLAAMDPARPTLVKIDVEGFEVQVLHGIRRLLEWPETMLVTEIADAKLTRAGHSRDELHRYLASFGFVPHTFHIQSSRWRKDFQIEEIPGPLESDEYDALFVRRQSAVFRDRVSRLLAGSGLRRNESR